MGCLAADILLDFDNNGSLDENDCNPSDLLVYPGAPDAGATYSSSALTRCGQERDLSTSTNYTDLPRWTLYERQ